MAFAGLLVFGAETGNDAQACPPEFRVSSPQPRAPDPTKLAYRTTTTTGSFTDSDRAVEGERYRDFALRASQQDSAFATFRQTYYSRHYAGIETDEKAKWNSAFYGQHVEATLKKIGRSDLLARALPMIVKLDEIGAGHTQRLKDSPEKVSGIFMRYLAKVADLERLFGSLDGMHIIEIGVGYGGFASLLLSLHPRIASYTLLDLPEVLNIAQRFLTAAKVVPTLRYINAAPCPDKSDLASKFETCKKGYDLAISMYAFAEVPLVVRKAYETKVVARSTRGWFGDHLKHKTGKRRSLPLVQRLVEDLRHTPGWGGNAPNISIDGGGTLVIRDFIMGPSPHEQAEAQVGWGVSRDYFPELLSEMQATEKKRPWAYPTAWQKLTLDRRPGSG